MRMTRTGLTFNGNSENALDPALFSAAIRCSSAPNRHFFHRITYLLAQKSCNKNIKNKESSLLSVTYKSKSVSNLGMLHGTGSEGALRHSSINDMLQSLPGIATGHA